MIDILLATYNSSEHLQQTLESILEQDEPHWRLLIRDGGSTDDTLRIIEGYRRRYSDKFIFFDSAGRSCACENFSALLSLCSSEYVMFCDHDDVWLKDKISRTLALMKKRESEEGPAVPLMVFTDKYVSDVNLTVISDSYFKYQNLNPKGIKLSQLLVQNVPSGCTILINRAFVDLCGTIPPQAVMHDHWLSLIGATMGKIVYLDVPTLLYRQHDKNYYGASKYGWFYFVNRLLAGARKARKRFYQNVMQAKYFLECYQSRLKDYDIQMLTEFSSLANYGWLKRRQVLLKWKIEKAGLLRNIGMFLIV